METVIDYTTSTVEINGLFKTKIQIRIEKIPTLRKRLLNKEEHPFKKIFDAHTILDTYSIKNISEGTICELISRLNTIPIVK